jgi:septal ring factor EnvC (AmiA/AmiB activator)
MLLIKKHEMSQMRKSCISCNREISKGQKECYVCGAPQSFLRFHSKTSIVFILFLSASAVLGYQYSEHKAQKETLDTASLLNSQITQSQEKISSLEQQLTKALEKVKNTEEQLGQTKSNALNVSDEIAQAKIKTEEAEQKTIKAEGRANWLSKENARQKAKIKALTETIAGLQTVQPIPAGEPENQITLQQEPEVKQPAEVESNEPSPVLTDGDN